jgi:hypothetical protein
MISGRNPARYLEDDMDKIDLVLVGVVGCIVLLLLHSF